MTKTTTKEHITALTCAGFIFLSISTNLNAVETCDTLNKNQIQAAAKAYNCSEKEAEKMLKSIRPEMRGMLLSGRMRKKCNADIKGSLSTAKPAAKTEPKQTPRRNIIETMKRINRQAEDENWPAAKAGAFRREYARTLAGSSLTMEELKKWVNNPKALPKIKQDSN